MLVVRLTCSRHKKRFAGLHVNAICRYAIWRSVGTLGPCSSDSREPSLGTDHSRVVRETLIDVHHRIRNLLGPLRKLDFVGRHLEPSLRQFELIDMLHESGREGRLAITLGSIRRGVEDEVPSLVFVK